MRESQPSYRGEEKKQAGSGEFERYSFWKILSRSADEIPFAPSEMLLHWHEVSTGNFFDEFGLAEPLLVGAALVVGHGGEGVHLAGNSPHGREF